jgi:hypothetical protein
MNAAGVRLPAELTSEHSHEESVVSDLIEYIKIQRASIHHSRNQEWRILVVVLSVFYALFNVPGDAKSLHIAITVLGLIACGIAAYVSYAHWLGFFRKMRIIRRCECELGIQVNLTHTPFRVQSAILLV